MFLQQLINGITQGSLFALMAISFSMVWGLLRMVNFALGEIYMFSAFLGWLVVVYVIPNIFVALVISLITGWFLGFIIEKAAFHTLRGAPHIASLICTLGFSVFLKELASVIFGSDTKAMPNFFHEIVFRIGESSISWLQLIMIFVAVFIMVGLQIFFYKTRVGLGIRAVSQDHHAAGLMGINVDRVISIAFSLAGSIAGVVGVLSATYYNAVKPTMGFLPGFKGFTAAVFGGITSIPGAILGGYLLGVIENLGVQYVSSGYRDLISYTILILFLLFRPSGILGKKSKL